MSVGASGLTQIRDLPRLFLEFVSGPINCIKIPRRLSWPAAFTAQGTAAVASGSLVAMVNHNLLDLVISLFVFPLVMIMSAAVFTLFIYYLFTTVFSTALDIRRVHAIVVISTVPYFLFHAFSGYLPPLDVLGFALTVILMTVGLVEQFNLPHRTVLKVTGGVFAAFFIVWSIVQLITMS